MSFNRREFVQLSSLVLAGGAISGISSCREEKKQAEAGSPEKLQSITGDITPIQSSERRERINKAQSLLLANGMDALVLDSGSNLKYFTGIDWWPSERTMVAILPAKGELQYVCPAFEESRFRERITLGTAVHTWQEDVSPYALIAQVIQRIPNQKGNIAIEEGARFFVADGIQKAYPSATIQSGDPITIPCRLIKSKAEIALMTKANEVTLKAIEHGVSQLKEGMSQDDLATIIMTAQNELGADAQFALCLFAESSAFPHGSKKPTTLKKGDIVLMDCGCSIDGYNADITRTVVFGAEPTERQLTIWNLEKKAQEAGFAAVKIGNTLGDVDFAARKIITDAGFGPDYQLPGLPHRTGHGIGLDGHEWGNAVRGNKQIIEPGMCFSIEPTIAIPGEFGVRLEDCVYITEQGPVWFSKPSKSLLDPFG